MPLAPWLKRGGIALRVLLLAAATLGAGAIWLVEPKLQRRVERFAAPLSR